MKRILVPALAALLVASAPVTARAVLEACKTTARDGTARLECDQVCENVETCVAAGKRVCNGTCDGGPNDGNSCDSDADCPDVSNVCVGGENDGLPCTGPAQCPDEVEMRCGGGVSNPQYDTLCDEDVDCQHEHFTCRAGTNEDQPCTSDADCPGSTCRRDPDSDPGCLTNVIVDARCGVNADCAERTTGDPVLCAVDVDFVKGSAANDVIFVGDGDVKVLGRAGDDTILKGAANPIRYMNGSPLNSLDVGRLLADGGPGNDFIGNSSPSEGDILFGGPDHDFLVGCGGRNILNGDGGDDLLTGWVFCDIDDGPLGSIYCGGSGDDLINAVGTGHQCIDAGADQTPPTSGYDCSYVHLVTPSAAKDAADVGTAANCASPDPSLAPEPCGCDRLFADVLFPIE